MLKKLLIVAAVVAKLTSIAVMTHVKAMAGDCGGCPEPPCFPGEACWS